MKQTEFLRLPVEDLIPYARNARTHTEEQIQKVADSIEEFGFLNPVIISEDNGILAGHCRVMAAQKLGMKDVPCIKEDFLTEAQKRAYIIADNKLALDAGWDEELLAFELSELKDLGVDLELTGFDLEEISHFLDATDEQEECSDGEMTEPPEEPKTKTGDVWILGQHRLMCGDSTDIASIALLMAGQKPDMLFTDPPYNVAFNGRSGKFDVIKNDDLPEDEFNHFMASVCDVIKQLDLPIYYIWCNWKFYATLQTKLPFKSCIVWAKNVFGLGKGYRHQHEFCLFNGEIDEEVKNESDLWEIAKDKNYVHPTQKPIELCCRALKNHKKVNKVLDLFGGSGSTLIACENLGRRAFVMELDPRYCDVIINRFQEMTGQQAIRESDGVAFDDVANESNVA